MARSTFKDLYAELAGLSHGDVPDLEINEDGSAGFSIHVSGLSVAAVQLPRGSINPNTAFFFMDLGAMPEDAEEAGWRALMQANFELLNDGAPFFSRRPSTGEVVLQYAYPMDRGDRATLLGSLLYMVRIGRQWREDHFLHSEFDTLAQAA